MKNFYSAKSIILIMINMVYSMISMDITRSSKMLLGTTNTYEVEQGCHEITIPNNFKKLIMNINSENLSSILITDSKIENCEEKYDLTKCCAKNSTFCIHNKNPTNNDFKLNYCIRKTNLYACRQIKETNANRILQNELRITNANSTTSNVTETNLWNITDTDKSNKEISTEISSNSEINDTSNISPTPVTTSGPGKLTIESMIIKDQGCQTAEFIPEVACSTLGLQNCKNPNFCSERCVYVECRTEMENPNSRVFSMCLPFNLTDSDINNRCRNHITFTENQPLVFKKFCEKSSNEHNQNEIITTSSHKFFKFLIFIIGVIVIFLFMASVYYRFSKKYNDGIPPFEAPWFIPSFIFPK